MGGRQPHISSIPSPQLPLPQPSVIQTKDSRLVAKPLGESPVHLCAGRTCNHVNSGGTGRACSVYHTKPPALENKKCDQKYRAAAGTGNGCTREPDLHSLSTPDPARPRPSPADGPVPGAGSPAILPWPRSQQQPCPRSRGGGVGGGGTARQRSRGVRSSQGGSPAAPWPVRCCSLSPE